MANKANVRAKNTMIALRRNHGNRCKGCGLHLNYKKVNLEFAHLTPCQMGRGRGRKERIYEVSKNPNQFILLCRACHLTFDSLLQERF